MSLAPFEIPAQSTNNSKSGFLGDYSKRIEGLKENRKFTSEKSRSLVDNLAKQNKKFDSELSKFSRTSLRNSPIKQKIYRETGFDSFVNEKELPVIFLLKILEIKYSKFIII